MGKISVVINTLNEEKNIIRSILSVKSWANEIVVVDMYSEDKTVDIARKLGAKVYMHNKTGYVEPARNYAINSAQEEWILILDADEEVGKRLETKIKEIIGNPQADYYRIPRKNIIFGKWIKHSRWWPDYNIRLFKKGCVNWSEIIHSVPETKGKGLDLDALEENAIIHYHYDSVEQYLNRLNRYTTEHAKLLIKSGYKFKWYDLIRKPLNEFLSRYFQAEGYKDGIHGIALSGLQSFSEFVMYLKIWQSEKFIVETPDIKNVINEMKKVESDLFYWESDTLLKEVGGIKNRIKRKLKLP